MRVEVRARRSGKTVDMILRASGTKNQIVCFSILECQRVTKVAKELEVDILPPITFEKYLVSKSKSDNITEGIYIDNLDLCLQYLTGYRPIKLVTLSEET